MLRGKFDCFNYHGKLAEASHSKKAEYSNRADLSAVYYIYCYEPRAVTLRNIPPSSCAHYDSVNMTLFHIFGDMPANWLSNTLSRIEIA